MSSVTQLSIEDILELAIEYKASDIHLKANLPPVFRIDGQIRSVPDLPVLDPESLRLMVYSFLTPRQQQMFEENFELDCALLFGDAARVRVNVYLDIDSVGAAMRIIPLDVPTTDELGLPPVIDKLTHEHQGLILVTGVTGAGKSTTLASMINNINIRDPKHIYTMEDPIEFVHRPKASIITQREIGFTTKSFANALKAALRADPDVLLVGEMRDPTTIQMALRAAETGHLVLSTLHTASAPKTIQRILGAFDPGVQDSIRLQLANCLKAVIAQQLVPMMGGGRICIQEIMICTTSIQDAILKGEIDSIYEFIKASSYDGMQTMDGALYNAYREGLVDADTARLYALNQGEMERILRGAMTR
ncbi:MAG: type IV pilus twitching motility protein PilT [Candidatus Obscuribacterales bacterium]|nr:type IV pilus twitching motility protein PilT [Candidatus Obscuribacterales bacterium]